MPNADLSLYQQEDIRLREKELDLRELEIKTTVEQERRSKWKSPLLVAVIGVW